MREGACTPRSNLSIPIFELYHLLLQRFGAQNWWPISYNFEPPEWEICVGAILTQNTNWRNVKKALKNLADSGVTTPHSVLKTTPEQLKKLIKPSGFYNQKAERLRTMSQFISIRSFKEFRKVSREELLALKGIGKETADSILLYALNRPYFVIDAYTKRIVRRLRITDSEDYEELRTLFEKSLPHTTEVYKEMHALLVEFAKRYCTSKPVCEKCFLYGLFCPGT